MDSNLEIVITPLSHLPIASNEQEIDVMIFLTILLGVGYCMPVHMTYYRIPNLSVFHCFYFDEVHMNIGFLFVHRKHISFFYCMVHFIKV